MSIGIEETGEVFSLAGSVPMRANAANPKVVGALTTRNSVRPALQQSTTTTTIHICDLCADNLCKRFSFRLEPPTCCCSSSTTTNKVIASLPLQRPPAHHLDLFLFPERQRQRQRRSSRRRPIHPGGQGNQRLVEGCINHLTKRFQSTHLHLHSHLSPAEAVSPAQSTTLDASANPRHPPTFHQPAYPGAATSAPEPPAVAATAATTAAASQQRRPYNSRDYVPQPPFASRAATHLQRPLRRLSAARLWNPTNSTPRVPTRKRRPSTPPPPAVPLSHPTLDTTATDPGDPIGTGAGDYPLLTLPEQRQIRHSTSSRASLQVDRAGSEKRVSLPRSVRHSYDEKRATPSPSLKEEAVAGPSVPKPEPVVQLPRATGFRKRGQSVARPNPDVGLTFDRAASTKLNKGKGKQVMSTTDRAGDQEREFSRDLERGPDGLGGGRHSTVSMPDGIGSAISSSNSSIMGDPEAQPEIGEEWGPQHPCFPHLNPHVPTDSPEYINTRIVRVRRDWLLEGDLAPTFSNLYPEILDPAGLSEQEFRRVVEKLNGELVPIFNPYSFRNMLDGVLGLVTGWLWEDFGFTGAKSRLTKLENWIEQWNLEMEKTTNSEEGAVAPKLISLRRTGYMSLDIQIGDPEIAPAPSTPAASRAGLPIDTPGPTAA